MLIIHNHNKEQKSLMNSLIILSHLFINIIHIMSNNLAKWGAEEDQLLREGVLRFGIKWELVRSHMSNLRSINSIIKRWHSKIKYQTEMKNVRESTGRYPKILPQIPPFLRRDPDVEETEERTVAWSKVWGERDDKKLKLLVIESGILSWDLLSQALQAPTDEIKLRWKRVVYPKIIRQSCKVGGSLKWSILQDKILNVGFKQGLNWEAQGKILLPNRSLGSIQARWRRVAKNFQSKSTTMNKYLARKECLRRIGRMRRQAAIEAQNRNGEIQHQLKNQKNDE